MMRHETIKCYDWNHIQTYTGYHTSMHYAPCIAQRASSHPAKHKLAQPSFTLCKSMGRATSSCCKAIVPLQNYIRCLFLFTYSCTSNKNKGQGRRGEEINVQCQCSMSKHEFNALTYTALHHIISIHFITFISRRPF